MKTLLIISLALIMSGNALADDCTKIKALPVDQGSISSTLQAYEICRIANALEKITELKKLSCVEYNLLGVCMEYKIQ